MTARTNLDRYRASTSEAAMQQAIKDILKVRGGRLWHVRDSSKSPELVNLLDWLILDPASETCYLVEAKSQRRIITPGQARVVEIASACHTFRSGIVRPVPRPGEWSYDDFIAMLGGS